MDESREIHTEDLEAAATVHDDLMAGAHYSKHEQACRELGFGIKYIG